MWFAVVGRELVFRACGLNRRGKQMTQLKERKNSAHQAQSKSKTSQGAKSPIYWMIIGAAIATASIMASFLVPDTRTRDAIPTAQPVPNQNATSALQK